MNVVVGGIGAKQRVGCKVDSGRGGNDQHRKADVVVVVGTECRGLTIDQYDWSAVNGASPTIGIYRGKGGGLVGCLRLFVYCMILFVCYYDRRVAWRTHYTK